MPVIQNYCMLLRMHQRWDKPYRKEGRREGKDGRTDGRKEGRKAWQYTHLNEDT